MKRVFNTAKNPFSLILYCLLLEVISLFNPTFAQDSKKLEELTRKLEELNRQIEACGGDLGCIQSKMNQIQQVSKEIQEFQKEFQNDPSVIDDELVNIVPKEDEFPPPFDKITKTWLKHTLATSKILRLDSNKINSTREEVLDKIDEIYKKKKGLTGPGWVLPLANCDETSVKLTEYGTINEPGYIYLDYNLQFVDKVVWLVKYNLIVGGKYKKLHDKLSYTLGLADQNERHTIVLNYSGWIMDQSENPPVKLPFTSYKILEQKLLTFVGTQVPSYKGYTMIFPIMIEDPKDKYKVGEVSEYKLILPYQIIRFYTAKPDEYVETTIDFMEDTFTPEEVQGFFEQGNLKKSYSSGGITQEIEIGSLSLNCDEQSSSGNRAIVLDADCIDHGGYVIANDKTTTTVNGKVVAKIGDKVLCFKHGKTEIIATNKSNVLSEKKQIARIGDKTKCGAKLLGGSMDTFAGDK